MLYRKEQDAQGDYMDELGNRFSVLCARRIRSTRGVNVGYEEFASLELALEEWKLQQVTPYDAALA